MQIMQVALSEREGEREMKEESERVRRVWGTMRAGRGAQEGGVADCGSWLCLLKRQK